jgi:hypothetical protein
MESASGQLILDTYKDIRLQSRQGKVSNLHKKFEKKYGIPYNREFFLCFGRVGNGALRIRTMPLRIQRRIRILVFINVWLSFL